MGSQKSRLVHRETERDTERQQGMKREEGEGEEGGRKWEEGWPATR